MRIQSTNSNVSVMTTGFEAATTGVQQAISNNGISAVKDSFQKSIGTDLLQTPLNAGKAVANFGMAGGLEAPSLYFNRYISSEFAQNTAVDQRKLAVALENPGPDRADVFTALKSAILEVNGGSTSDGTSTLNTATQMYLTEANDAEARMNGLFNDYTKLLQDMRK